MQTVFKKGEPCPKPTTANDALFVDNYKGGKQTLIYKWDNEGFWVNGLWAICIWPKDSLPMGAELIVNYFDQPE